MLLEINHLEKVFRTRFSKEETRALQDVDFKVDKGEFIAIMGESGSGKTTLLNILATLEKPTNGSIFLNGTNVTKIKESQKVNLLIFVSKISDLFFKISICWIPCLYETIFSCL